MSKRREEIWRRDGIRYQTRPGSQAIYAVWYDQRRRIERSTGYAVDSHKRRDVEAAGRDLREEFERNRVKVDRNDPPLSTWAEMYGKAMVTLQRNEKHIKTQLDRWETIIGHYGDAATLAHVTTDSVMGLVDELREDGLAGQTIEHYLKLLRRAFKDAKDRGFVYRNPTWPRLERADKHEQAGEYIDPAEVYRVADELDRIAREHYRKESPRRANCVRTRDLIVWVLNTGMRREECERLRSDWICDRAANLPASGTKTKRPRRIPLTDAALEIANRRKGELVFGAREYKRILARACDAVGAPRFHLRDLRHTCATEMGNQPGADVALLMQFFGWTNPETAQRYLHAPKNRMDQLVASLGGALGRK